MFRTTNLAQPSQHTGAQFPRGIFGTRPVPNETQPRQAEIDAGTMPPPGTVGPISGFGGGTFNLDGSQATPADNPAANGPLGASMRQPFDYQAVASALQPQKRDHENLRRIAGVIAAGLAGAAGNQGAANAIIQGQQGRARDQRELALKLADWQHGDWARQNDADLRAAEPFSSGRDRVQYDPATGQSHVVYDGPQDFENYAATLGLHPGSPEYFKAAEDYVLKSNGPSALERDTQLDDHRTANDRTLQTDRFGNQVSLERLRQGNRMGMEGVRQDNRTALRQTPSYTDLHPHAPRAATARPTATGPNGQKVQWDGKAWVPAK